VKYIIDACAAIALIRNEPGADMVRDILRASQESEVLMHAINFCEVYYDTLRTTGPAAAQDVLNAFESGLVCISEEIDMELCAQAGTYKAMGRISLADAFALALATRHSAVLVTSDRHEFGPFLEKSGCPVTVQYIR
jgi:predicted nucleic acid-binding protein